jgi:sugar lactone lactonase YvrE
MSLSPSGRILETFHLPTGQPNRCAFGGTNLDTLYVTTGAGELLAGYMSWCGFTR